MSAIVSSPTALSRQPPDVAAKVHHNKHGTGFVNPWPSYIERSGSQMLGNILWMRLSGQWKDPDTTPPTVPVRKPEFLPSRQTGKLRATWLGHACYYVEFPSGLRVLFDPVLTERCSPFARVGPKRFTEIPCQVEDIPFIDAVVISHNHYDHLSHPTIQRIAKKYPNAHYFVGLGNKPWFKHMGLDDTNVTEMDWWEEKQFTLSPAERGEGEQTQADISAVIGCLPCQHTSARTAFDKAQTLWASWSVTSGGKKIWFGGDTGYRAVPAVPEGEFDYSEKYADLPHCPAFAQIGELRGPFDLGLIPIGAYDPRHIMSPMHANPYDSVNIFVDTKCKKALGIHWGTWVLTSEEVMEPPRVLREALKWKGIEEKGVFETCDIGESRVIEPSQPGIWHPLPAQRPNILMTLPAELRNVIYEALLVRSEPIKINCVKHPRWRDPRLLRVSKAIRAEASTIYYKGNDFDFSILLSSLPGLCAKLLRLTERWGLRPVRSLRMTLYNPRWCHMHVGNDLAMLAYRGVQLYPIIRPGSLGPQEVISSRHDMCGTALVAALKIGEKGVEEDWGEKRMRARLKQWLALCLSSKAGGKHSKLWKLAIGI
ncbi:hypothetical protein LTR12_008991 [Friedmanniomyces endolithicus]|nr:hypothetical protein LTR12_008991 [Friedmanniomyces endolithicus]